MTVKLSTNQQSASRSGIKRGMLRSMQNNETSDATLCILFQSDAVVVALLYAKVAQLYKKKSFRVAVTNS